MKEHAGLFSLELLRRNYGTHPDAATILVRNEVDLLGVVAVAS